MYIRTEFNKRVKVGYKETFAELFGGIPMKVRYGLCFLLGMMVVGIPWISSCAIVENYEDDNFLEEVLEEVIEAKTGLDIDLTPYSPEE